LVAKGNEKLMGKKRRAHKKKRLYRNAGLVECMELETKTMGQLQNLPLIFLYLVEGVLSNTA
jgi:hypothetical protein